MTAALSRAELEAMAAALEASGEYRIVRRLEPCPTLPAPPADTRLGLVVDVETTGSDVRGDEVIELAMVRFAYSPDGEVLGVIDTFQGYHEPTRPISAEITALTGISAEMDADAVGAFGSARGRSHLPARARIGGSGTAERSIRIKRHLRSRQEGGERLAPASLRQGAVSSHACTKTAEPPLSARRLAGLRT